jgi:hypothetical protein
MVEIVTATRLNERDFRDQSALGKSLLRISQSPMFPRVAFENRAVLPSIYNACIDEHPERDIIVFIHDDVWIDDIFLTDRVSEGLEKFDILGVCGNRRRLPKQQSWAFVNTPDLSDDVKYLSGAIGHGKEPCGEISRFGPSKSECELLDGVFLATRKSTLKRSGTRFDDRFGFHFYDMDFCRTAREHGLKLGTWPICLTHQSDGNFKSESWAENYRKYLEKWGS